MKWAARFPVCKVDKAKRQVFGFASSSVLGGQLVVDHQKDRIQPDHLERGAYGFASWAGPLGEMHDRVGVGQLIESMVTTPEKRAALQIPGDDVRWWVGFQVTDPATWTRVESGELAEFSIAGHAKRVPMGDGTFELQDLDLAEVSLVDAGAGIGVPVTLAKRRGGAKGADDVKTYTKTLMERLRKSGKATPDQIKTIQTELAKGEVTTLADVQAALPPELWAVVLQAIDAAAMGAAPAPEAPEAPVENAAPEAPAAPPAEEDPMAPKRNAPAAAPTAKAAEAAELAKMREEMAALKKAQAEAQAELAKERHAARLAKAQGRVREDFWALSGTEEALAKVLLALEDVTLAKGAAVSIPVEVAATLEALLKRAQAQLAESALMEAQGSTEGGTEDYVQGRTEGELTLRQKALAITKANPKVTMAQAMVQAAAGNPDAYRAHRNA